MSDTIELMWGPQDGRTTDVPYLTSFVMVAHVDDSTAGIGQLKYVRGCGADCVELVHPYWYTTTMGRQ